MAVVRRRHRSVGALLFAGAAATAALLLLSATATAADEAADTIGDEELEEEDALDYEDSVEDPLFDTTPQVLVKGALAGAYGNKLPIGKEAAILCGVVNNGEDAIHVIGLAGTVNDPNDASRVLMNFTGQWATPVNETLPADSEATYAHSFRMPAKLEPQQFLLTLHVFYQYERQELHQTFFNQTVEFVRAEEPLDADLAAKYLFTVVAIAVIAWIIFKLAARGTPSTAKAAAQQNGSSDMSYAKEYAKTLAASGTKPRSGRKTKNA